MISRCREVAAAGLLVLVLTGPSSFAQSGDARLAAKFKEATEAQRVGRLDEAAAAYAEVLKLRPDIAEVYINLGLVRHQQKRFEEAVAALEKGLSLKPGLAGGRLFLGISYYSLNRLEPALKELEQAAALAPNDPRAVMWYGVALLAAGKTTDAAKHLDQAATLASEDIDILYHRGRAHLRLSQESYREMFKVDPKSARVHQVLAQSYEEAGREADAIAEYELAVKLAPDMPGVNEALGSLYWKTANLDAAEAAFERELKVDPRNVLAMYKLGSIRVERSKPEQGMPLLEAALRQNPDNLDAYYYLGKAQGQLGQHDPAIANLKKLIEGKPSSPLAESAYYQLSRIYRKVGRTVEAQAALVSFQKLKDEREQQRTEKLDEIKKRVSDGTPRS